MKKRWGRAIYRPLRHKGEAHPYSHRFYVEAGQVKKERVTEEPVIAVIHNKRYLDAGRGLRYIGPVS